MTLLTGLIVLTACDDRKLGPGKAAAVSLDSIASPSIVVGDSLRDTLGAVRPMWATAYDDDGNPISGFTLKFRALDAGITLDSLTGVAVGDSIRNIPLRVLVDAAGLQTPATSLFVVQRPDVLGSAKARDTLFYSVIDTATVYKPLTALLTHTVSGSSATGVQAYIVSFKQLYPSDTALARPVDEAGAPSLIDTTSSDGIASRLIRVRPARFTSVVDSVVLEASARYRGALVAGSPVRLVLEIRPNP
jgi:hypothetical protein